MKDFIRQCEEHLAMYHGHASSFFMTFMVVAVCGFISPSLLFAAEIESSVANPVPALREYDREKPKIAPMKPVAVDMMSTSSPGKPMNPGVFSTSSQEKLIQYRNARIQKLIASLLALEKSSAELRAELQKIQTSSPSSTKAINMGQVEKQINAILNQFKKTNFNSEFSRLKSELKVEQSKRVNVEKKELLKKQTESKNEMPSNSKEAVLKRDAKRLSDLRQLQTALELYYTDQNAYPVGPNIVLGVGNAACLNATGFTTENCSNPYMGKVPRDPSPGQAYTYNSVNNSYTITVVLEGTVKVGSQTGVLQELKGTIVMNPSGIRGITMQQ